MRLDRPASIDHLYLDRGDPADPWRPIMSGDVFSGVEIPGVDEHELVLLISHPCSMRRGPDLIPRLQALPVVTHAGISLEQWETGFFRVFPLPDLVADDGNRHYAARLTEFGMVASDALDLDCRVACLSESGVVLLLQRFFHCMARVHLLATTLSEHAAPALEEASLLEEWNETVCCPRVDAGADRGAVLREEAAEFDTVLSAAGPGEALRAGLEDPAQRPAVRRRVRAAMKARLDVVTT